MMRLDPAAFARTLEHFAEDALYRNSFACPCVNKASGSPKHNCQHCNGKGWLWTAPKPIGIAVCSSSVQQAWAKMGSYESGDLVVSLPHTSPAYQMAPFDRVTLLKSADTRSEAFTRGAPNERITGALRGISRVFWFDGAGNTVEGRTPTVNADGTLNWPDVGGPPLGQQYSITWERLLEYFAFTQFAGERAKHNLPLPRRMVLRRFEILGRTGSPKTV